LAALRSGLLRATRGWPWLLPLWLANLAIGLVASLPLLLTALGPIGRQAWLGDLADRRWPEALVGLVGAGAAAALAAGPQPPIGLLLAGLGLALLAPLAQALAYAALAGSLIARYLGRAGPAAARAWRWP